MIQCNKCEQVFKYRNAKKDLKEHNANYHDRPKFNKDGSIQLNAVHQVTLILKRGKMWKTVLKDRIKTNDESGLLSTKQLMRFEKNHDLKFIYHNDIVGFYQNTKEDEGKA